MNEVSVTLNEVAVADGDVFSLGVVEQWDPAATDREIQVAPRMLADYPDFFDRVTLSEGLVLVVARQHASYRAAATFERTHAATVSGVGAIVFTLVEDGVTWTCTYAADNRIGPVRIQREGLFTQTTYQLSFAVAPSIDEDGGGTVIGARNFETIAFAAAGSDTVSFGSTTRETRVRLQPGAGAGAYTRKVVLPTASRQRDDECEIRLEMPASGNPTIEIRNATDAGTVLDTVAPFDGGVARTLILLFIYSGSAWIAWSKTDIT